MPRALPIDDQLERAAQLVVRARIFYDIWFYFEGEETRPAVLDTMNCFSEFFRFDPHAHFVAFIVHVAALFEKRKDSINLPRLTKEMKKTILISESTHIQVDKLLSQAAPLASKAIILRSNLFAHRTASHSYADVFNKAAVTPNQLRELTEIGLSIANHLLSSRGRRHHHFNPLPREHVHKMLKALARFTKS